MNEGIGRRCLEYQVGLDATENSQYLLEERIRIRECEMCLLKLTNMEYHYQCLMEYIKESQFLAETEERL